MAVGGLLSLLWSGRSMEACLGRGIEFGEWRWDGIEFGAVAMALKVDPIDIFK